MKKIAIIIPTYEESENIQRLVKQIKFYIHNVIIFIIDDTPSAQISKMFKPNNKEVKYFHRKNKKGRGSAVLFGIEKALRNKQIDMIIEMDADFSHNPNELKNKINYFKRNNLDMLIASRYLKSSEILNWSYFRRIFSFLSNFLARIFLRIDLKDFTNGFRLYSIRAARKIIKKCGNIGDGFIILSEIIVVVHNSHFRIKELPTIFKNRKRGKSSVTLKLIFQSLFGLIKLSLIKKKL